MAITISQLLSASYEAVVSNTPEDQWSESAALRAMEKAGMIKRIPGGPTIEVPVDYQQNPDADFLANDFTPVGMDKTEVLTAASYTPAQLSVPMKWSKGDEAKNPETNQKVPLVKSILENGLASHDEAIETAMFASSDTDGFHSLTSLLPTSGQGTVGGINAANETWWRNPVATYNSNFSDIESVLTTLYNTAKKGSGSKAGPKLLVGSIDAVSGFEGTQQSLQRYVDSKEAHAGFMNLFFKDCPFVFSHRVSSTDDPIWGLSAGSFNLVVFKNAYRQKGETIEIPNAHGYVVKIYSALQAIIRAKSRAFVAYHS